MTRRAVSKYRDRSSRTSSGSRDSERVVNPTRSANRTDTRRRSAIAGSRATARRDAGADVGPPPRGVPHSPQNRSSTSFAAPQFGQASASAFPQAEQNFRPGRFSVPQLEQITRFRSPAFALSEGSPNARCWRCLFRTPARTGSFQRHRQDRRARAVGVPP